MTIKHQCPSSKGNNSQLGYETHRHRENIEAWYSYVPNLPMCFTNIVSRIYLRYMVVFTHQITIKHIRHRDNKEVVSG